MQSEPHLLSWKVLDMCLNILVALFLFSKCCEHYAKQLGHLEEY